MVKDAPECPIKQSRSKDRGRDLPVSTADKGLKPLEKQGVKTPCSGFCYYRTMWL
jgi:hypothetical protein